MLPISRLIGLAAHRTQHPEDLPMITRNGTTPIDRTISRRRLLGRSAALAGGLVLARPLFAGAHSTPAASDTAPDVTFTVTADAIKGPAEIVSGINHVTVENQTGQDGVHSLTMQLPEGVTNDDLVKLQQSEDAPVPDWWMKATMVGNPDWPVAGGVSEGYIDYPAGNYAIMNIFGSQWTTFTVKDGATKAPEPASDIAVETKLMNFTGLDDGIAAGRHLWKVTNTDMVAHEMAFIRVPAATTTVDEIIETLMSSEDLSKLPAGYASMPGGTGIITPGVSMWLSVDLPAGDYAAVCFAPDGWNGPPHALMGMIKVFSVS
jgi:hypothetical protein